MGQIIRQQQRDALFSRRGRMWSWLHTGRGAFAWALLGAVLIVLLYQIPVRHPVDIGGYDAAYVRGFHDPQDIDLLQQVPPYLDGSDGSVRWSRDRSFLLFPQAGLPGTITLHLRGWRTDGPPPQVEVLLNGRDLLGTIQTTGAWEQHQFSINGGLLKATDIFVELRAETTTLPDEGRTVGVLLDSATYRVSYGSTGLIMPYPAQVAYGALAAGLIWLLTHLPRQQDSRPQRRARPVLLGLLLGLAFLLLYRLQPPLYPYPLRWLLPSINLLLLALLALRYVPALVARRPWLLDGAALMGVALWTGGLALAARGHVTLSRPGVENDFGVFAGRSASLAEVFRADGFYNLGYPLLLWLVRPLTADNPFLAGRVIALLSGVVFLLAAYWLARRFLAQQNQPARAGALLVLLLLALSPFVVEYSLYVGSDMPFAALTTLAVALLVFADRRHWPLIALAGFVAGCAFLVRHLGIVLLLWGVLSCVLLRDLNAPPRRRVSAMLSGPWVFFALGFGLAALPQIGINLIQTGEPLYNQQAKNVWLAVYGNIDWGRWGEVRDSLSLLEIVLRDPGRFVGNWGRNLLGFIGSGAEDTSEFGQAIQLRLLGWPANWLAVAGLLVWLFHLGQWFRKSERAEGGLRAQTGILLLITLYVLVASTAFILPRFFLPLAPIYALAAAWMVRRLLATNDPAHTGDRGRRALAVGLVLLALLWHGFGIGTGYVLANQPVDEVVAIRLVQSAVEPDERVLARVPADAALAQYSAIAHQMVAWSEDATDDAAYLLWHETFGPPPVPDPAAARIGTAEGYQLFEITTKTTKSTKQ